MSGDSGSRAEMRGLAQRIRVMTGSWASRSLPARCLLVASAVLTVAAAVASGVLAARQEDEALRVVVLLLSGSGAIAVMVTKLVGARSPRVILDPLAGPLLYLVYCLVLPLAYMQVTGRGIQWMPSSMLNGATVAVLCLSISGFIIGAAAVQILGGPIADPPADTSPGTDRRGPIVRDIGRAILVLAFVAKVYQLIVEGPVFLRVYGADQLVYDVDTVVGVLGGSLVPVGALLVMHGNMKVRNRPLAAFDWILLGAIVLITLVFLGNRSEVIAPVVLFLWFQLGSRGRFSRTIVVGVIAAAGAAFAVIAQLRVRASGAEAYPLVENILVDTSSPVLLTSDVTRLVPSQVDFFWGSTYVEALKYMLPGPVSRALFGDPTGTGAFVYRDLIDFHSTGQGWGFAQPTEAYMNFGFAGVIVIAALLGVLYAWAHQSALRTRDGVRSLIYPLLLSYLAFGVRSDALGQLKSIVYPLIIIIVALAVEKFLLGRTGGVVGSSEWRWSSLASRPRDRQ